MNKTEFDSLIVETNIGKDTVEKYSKQCKGRTIFLVFPYMEIDAFLVAYNYLDSLLRRYNCIFIFSVDKIPELPKEYKDFCRNIVLSENDMDAVMRYSLVAERESVRIISFSNPDQLDARKLYGIGGITKESYMYRALFGNFAGTLKNE